MSNPEKETSEYTLDKDIKVLLEWYYETNNLKKEKKEGKIISYNELLSTFQIFCWRKNFCGTKETKNQLK